jgi:N-acetylglucosaminyldiphosphoundecaprenol N-acetyl-beta-D-mannosaminyltransferase
VRIHTLPPEAARQELVRSFFGSPRSVHLCNAYTLSIALTDPRYRSLLNHGDLNLADGQPVAFMGRRLGHPAMRSSVRGPDLLQDVLELGQTVGLRHFFYGSTDDVVGKLGMRLTQRFPTAKVVGIESAPFRALTHDEVDALVVRVLAAQPDILWVGLGTPLQDAYVEEFKGRLNTTLVAIGAGFDFLAGTKPLAPHWMHRIGLEWLFRLATEPRRLWRRYLIGNTVFLMGASRDLFRRSHQ